MLLLRLAASSLFVLALLPISACEQPVPTLGFDISEMFPATTDHYWRYDNDGRAEVTYWISEGETSPFGEPLTTFALWIGAEQDIIDDYSGDQAAWAVRLYFAHRSNGYYLAGWEANPDGPSPAFGTVELDGDGVPFALSNVARAQTFDADSGGADWTTTFVGEEAGPFEFNGQSYTDVWHINITSSIGNFPFEGDFWLKAGPGIIQYDIVGYRPATGEPWTHVHNDVIANILGQN